MAEITPLENVPGYEVLRSAEEYLVELTEGIKKDDFVTEKIRQRFYDAHERTAREAIEIASAEDLQDGLADEGARAVKGLAQVAVLERGEPADVLNDLRAPLIKPLEAATKVYESYGAKTERAVSVLETIRSAGNLSTTAEAELTSLGQTGQAEAGSTIAEPREATTEANEPEQRSIEGDPAPASTQPVTPVEQTPILVQNDVPAAAGNGEGDTDFDPRPTKQAASEAGETAKVKAEIVFDAFGINVFPGNKFVPYIHMHDSHTRDRLFMTAVRRSTAEILAKSPDGKFLSPREVQTQLADSYSLTASNVNVKSALHWCTSVKLQAEDSTHWPVFVFNGLLGLSAAYGANPAIELTAITDSDSEQPDGDSKAEPASEPLAAPSSKEDSQEAKKVPLEEFLAVNIPHYADSIVTYGLGHTFLGDLHLIASRLFRGGTDPEILDAMESYGLAAQQVQDACVVLAAHKIDLLTLKKNTDFLRTYREQAANNIEATLQTFHESLMEQVQPSLITEYIDQLHRVVSQHPSQKILSALVGARWELRGNVLTMVDTSSSKALWTSSHQRV